MEKWYQTKYVKVKYFGTVSLAKITATLLHHYQKISLGLLNFSQILIYMLL